MFIRIAMGQVCMFLCLPNAFHRLSCIILCKYIHTAVHIADQNMLHAFTCPFELTSETFPNKMGFPTDTRDLYTMNPIIIKGHF